jgi:tetratricopeptide (TPR) repeat protein
MMRPPASWERFFMRRTLALSLCAAALSMSLPALAAKLPPPKEDLGKKAPSVSPDKSLAGDITRKKTAGGTIAPTLKFDQFSVQIQLQVASKRHEQIEYLQKIIQLGADDKEMPGLLFRLAELYWEESKYYFNESNRKDDEIFAAKDRKDEATVARLTGEKTALVTRSTKFQDEAIGRYREIVQKYPKFQRMDEVLYFLGHNLWDSNKEKDALAIYKALITRYPKSKYIPDAWLAFGEFYFNGSNGKKEEIAKALASYKHAAENQDSSVYGFAIYKQAWCQYNLSDFKQALDLFKAVVFYGELATQVNHDNKTALVREARKDYVLTYSHFGDPLGAEDDFKKVGGAENWLTMFKGLAGLYYEDGKDKEAVLSYRRLIQLQPLSPEAPMFQARIVDAVLRVGKKQITLEQVRTLVRIIQEVKKAGVIKSDADKKAMAEAEDLSERTMSNLAVNWHNEAKKTRDEQTFVLANEVYADYLEIFPESKKSYDLRFFWAELLNDSLLKFDKAADQYNRVVAIDAKRMEAKTKPGKWLTVAAYDAVLAWDEVAKKAPPAQAPKDDPTGKMVIPDAQKGLLKACEAYVKYVPKGDKVVEVSYKAAQIYYKHNYYDDASKRFDDICVNHPENEVAEYACNLVVDTRNLKGDLQGVYDTAKRYLANDALMKAHPKLHTDLKAVIEQTAFKLVSQLESKGLFVSAAKKYLGYVDEFPKSGLSDSALFNASVDFFKGHHFDDSFAARARLVKEYPGSKYVPDSIYANGEAAESVGEFEGAAAAYEQYARNFQKQSGLAGGLKAKAKGGRRSKKAPPRLAAKQGDSPQHYDEAKAQAALFNAGVFREGLAEYKQALNDRNQYLDMWPEAKDSEAVFLSIASLYEKQNQVGKAVGQYMEYEKRQVKDQQKVLTAEAKIVKLYQKVGSKKPAAKKREEIYKAYNKMYSAQKKKVEGAALEQVAWANYEANDPNFGEYVRSKLKLNIKDPQSFKKELKEKAQKMAVVQKAYTETVNYKVAGPGVCALMKIGDAYAHLEKVLKEQKVPSNLPQEIQDGIREGLEQQSEPLKAKAAEAYQLAVAKSRELNAYNDCSERALGQLSETFAADQYPRVTESFAEVKGLPVPKEGTGLLATIQPIPTPDKEEAQVAEKIAAPPAAQPDGKAEASDDHPPAHEDEAPKTAPIKTTPASTNPGSSTDKAPVKDEPADDVVN